MDQKHIVRYLSLCAAGLAGLLVLAGCDGGDAGNTGGSTGSESTSTGTPPDTSSTGSPSTTTGNPSSSTTSTGTTTGAINCANGGYCSQFGMGGYAFGYADSQNMAPQSPGTSTATLPASGDLCISGTVMQLPAMPTAADYSNDWGCGIGVNLNQMMGMDMPKGTYTPTTAGVTLSTSAVPSCTAARIIVDSGGTDYCAPITTPGAMIPWSSFNTTCWMPTTGTPLSGPPTTTAVKIQFVTSSSEACPFTDFCITALSI